MSTGKQPSSARPLPPAPAGFSFDKAFPGLHWHQSWELFQDVFTPGCNPVSYVCEKTGLPQDLSGMRVLDIGAWHGCFSFECERRGASEVVALSPQGAHTTGFRELARLCGSKVVRWVDGTVYEMDAKKLGKFDLVLFFGVLYHLRYPLLAIDNIANVSRGTVLTETHCIDKKWLVRGGDPSQPLTLDAVNPQLAKVPLWRYYHNGELMGDFSNAFGPNSLAVVEAFESAGFDAEVVEMWGDRVSFRARLRRSLDDALKNTYESYSRPSKIIKNEAAVPGKSFLRKAVNKLLRV